MNRDDVSATLFYNLLGVKILVLQNVFQMKLSCLSNIVYLENTDLFGVISGKKTS